MFKEFFYKFKFKILELGRNRMKEEIYQMENIFNFQKKYGGGGGVKFVKLVWN